MAQDLKDSMEEANIRSMRNQIVDLKIAIEELSLIPSEKVEEGIRAKMTQALATSEQVLKDAQGRIRFAERIMAEQSGSASKSSVENSLLEMKIQWKAIPFSGVLREWLTFWDQFRSNVHENSRISINLKAKCLAEYLKRDAKACLGDLAITGINYDAAVETLLQTFNVPTKLRTTFIDELNELSESHDAKTHRQNFDKIKGILRNLQAIRLMSGEEEKEEDGNVKREILRKFPVTLLQSVIEDAYSAAGGNFHYSIAQLMEASEVKVTVAEHIAQERGEVVKMSTVVLAGGVKRQLEAGASNQKKSKTTKSGVSCTFCGLPHPAENCRKIASSVARRQVLMEKGLCFRCMLAGHTSRDCRVKVTCTLCNKTDHPTPLCRSRDVKGGSRNGNTFGGQGKEDITFLETFTCCIIGEEELGKEGIRIEVRGMLDGGSQKTFIEEGIKREVGIKGSKNVTLECQRFLDESRSICHSQQVLVTLQNKQGVSRKFWMNTSPCIMGDMDPSPPSQDVMDVIPSHLWNRLADEDLLKDCRRPIKLLIGSDIYGSIIKRRDAQPLIGQAELLESFFGWIPSGNTGFAEVTEAPQSSNQVGILAIGQLNLKDNEASTSHEVDRQLSHSQVPGIILCGLDSGDICNLWSLENLGIENPDLYKSGDLALEHYHKNKYVLEDGRVCVRLPWKASKEKLPSNYRMAIARLQSMLANTPPHICEQIDDQIKEQLRTGILEYAPENRSSQQYQGRNRMHYLPYKWIMQNNKLRLVYDASAHIKTGVSLNQMLHEGIKLTENLVGLLINFRIFPIALTADIEKAFLQISLNELNRDVTRSLWVKDWRKLATQGNLCYVRFARLPFGINASPFLLNMVLQDLFLTHPTDKYLQLCQHKFYVDNLVVSVSSPIEALGLYDSLVQRLGSAKMNLRNWATNDKQVWHGIPEYHKDVQEGPISILGLIWNKEADTFNIKLNENSPSEGTKENILRFMASIYDPLGWFSPCFVEIKVLLQKCWKNKYNWHDLLPDELLGEWNKIRYDLIGIDKVIVPRCLFPIGKIKEYSLHIFCNASAKAYACYAYLIGKGESGLGQASLVFTKMKTAPKRLLSIPRLELMAVLIGKRTLEFLVSKLDIPIKDMILWSDATTVLHWLNSKEVLQPFIQNRVTEIKKARNIIVRYVPTEDNPADYASRGKTPKALTGLELWWNGPTWLLEERLWPHLPDNVELYKFFNIELSTIVLATIGRPIVNILPDALEKRFSSWNRLVTVFSIIAKVLAKINYEVLESNPQEVRPLLTVLQNKLEKLKEVSLIEFRLRGERLLLRALQLKYFLKEIRILEEGGKPLNNLDLFLGKDQDIPLLRCKGRLQFAQFPWETKHPILLPRESPATKCLVHLLHIQLGHAGTTHILSKLRERFWITKARALINSVVHKCITCKRWEGGSYELPPMAPLPEMRVATIAPFLHIGVDYFGPMNILGPNKEIMSVYSLIFTCLVTRAIHLEVVPEQSGWHFLLALERFSCIRRVPQKIISDNGASFVFIQPMVGTKVKIIDSKVQAFCESNYIEWSFIPQYAPWFGGAYERLIGIVKRSLKKSYGMHLLTYVEMQTALYRIMDIVNSRPLTYMSATEVLQPLTPNHFLKLGASNVNVDLQPMAKEPLSATGTQLVKDWETLCRVLDAFWDAFRGVYLLSLRERHLLHHPEKKGKAKGQPKVGDIVIVREVSAPRADWKLGRILELDRRQAVATVLWKEQKITRSIRHLYPLELNIDSEEMS